MGDEITTRKRKLNKFPALTNVIVGKTPEGRNIYRNELDSEGRESVSSERSATFEFDGKFFNYPTMFGGKEKKRKEILKIFKKNKGVDPETGIQSQPFNSHDEALEAAEARSPGLSSEK